MRMNAARQQRIGGPTTLRARLIPNERRLPSDGNVADGGAMLLNHAERRLDPRAALAVPFHLRAVGAHRRAASWPRVRARRRRASLPLLLLAERHADGSVFADARWMGRKIPYAEWALLRVGDISWTRDYNLIA